MTSFLICFLSILLSFQASQAKNSTDSSNQLLTHIIHLRVPNHIAPLLIDTQKRESYYTSLLSQIVSDEADHKSSRLVHSYHRVFHGFAARLTTDELEALEQLEGFVSAWPDQIKHVQTTHSPEFMGLDTSGGGLWEKSEYGSGIIIGVLDSGINAFRHISFMGVATVPPPSRWKGTCHESIRCNNKLIGAKSFIGGSDSGSPADDTGHGSHVAGIAAGNMVRNANAGGEGSGTASGIAPRAHLAVYKVCHHDNCTDSDILAGFDAAIADGVDVISISLGYRGGANPFHRDSVAIGSFAAMKRGILVSASAGNSGPSPGTVGNEAPWLLTVGASTTDRDITVGIQSVLQPDGIGFKGTSYGDLHAPTVAAFSSRGPSRVGRGIIKPDIIGPGVDIIAPNSNASRGFVFMSGTSMACPHLSGAAALIKASHPDWSPAAIKSALMTTAYQNNLSNRPIDDAGKFLRAATVFAMGAGHVDVVRANDPGLIFDIQPDDYIPYLCSLRDYSSRQVSAIVGGTVDCATFGSTSQAMLNYPSIFIDIPLGRSYTISRTVTNVGSDAGEVYRVEIIYKVPGKFLISVDPQQLQFSGLNVKKTYQVTFNCTSSCTDYSYESEASIVWRSNKHVVRSPVMVI